MTVFVRLSAPPRYSVSEGRDTVVVELPNTGLERKNDARPLDTSFFPGAVAKVTPRRQGASMVVEIVLKERVGYRQRVEGDVLSIEFDRAGSR